MDIFKPSQKILTVADVQQLDTIERIRETDFVDVWVEETECIDFTVDRQTGNIEAPLLSITINGIAHHLKPGKNKIPGFVSEVLDRNRQAIKDSKAVQQRLQQSQCIGIMGD